MSGGVDSSVAAALLVEQGYEVIGVMLRLWAEDAAPQPVRSDPNASSLPTATPGTGFNRCCSLESIHDARAVADRLGIPFYVINAEEPFKKNVVDFFVEQYSTGRTPNPCLACNRRIRFGFLLAYARSLGARYLATGHYARIRRGEDGRYQLWRGADRGKDQSYVLSVLSQAELAQALFPVGEYSKPEVRALAAARRLPTASRVESQDLCFIADGDYRRFLAQHAGQAIRPGPILDRHGRQLGTHRGLPFYTIGQRSGLGIAAPQPLYVLALDMVRNALIVGTAADLEQRWLRAEQVNWIAGEPPPGPIQAAVQVRYRAEAVPATIFPHADAAKVYLAEPVRAITPGQAAVFYDGEICLGGGIIAEARNDTETSVQALHGLP